MKNMTTEIFDLDRAHTEQTSSDTESVRRSAFYLESQGQPLFAWLHHRVEPRNGASITVAQCHLSGVTVTKSSTWPCDEGARFLFPHGHVEDSVTVAPTFLSGIDAPVPTGFDHGVLICPPIGYEQLHSHRSLRHLADRLAQEKVPVVRFDWHGTGDSAGVDEDSARLTTWLANMRDAVQWMREQLGCRQISLVGLRLGGTLAALVAAELEIDNLVLWSPVTKGRAYVREMKAISLTAEAAPRDAVADGSIEAAGFVLSAETAGDLSQLDLLHSQPQCRHVLLVSRDDLPDDIRLSDHLSATGLVVETLRVPGFVEMMQEPHRSQVPAVAITQITTWLVQRISATASSTAMIDLRHTTPTSALISPAVNSLHNEISQYLRESAVRFSERPDLFGIVCEPVVAASNDLPLVVLLNAGSSYRIGPGRLYVFLSRQLAAQGFRTVRLDLCSLGDSVSLDSEHENDPHPATAFRDVDLVLKQLQQRYGATKIVLMGLCSGAYAAFQSAAQIQNPALVESVLINPLTFFWKEGMSLDVSSVKQLVSVHYYLDAALQPKKWLRLLRGQTKIGFVGAAKIVLRKLGVLRLATPATRRDASKRSCVIEPNQTASPRGGASITVVADAASVGSDAGSIRHEGTVIDPPTPSHPQDEDVPGDLDRIAHSGRTLSLFFATTDPGFSILTHYAQRKVKQLRRTGQLNVSFIPDADHTFTMRAARQTLSREISDHLCRRYHSADR